MPGLSPPSQWEPVLSRRAHLPLGCLALPPPQLGPSGGQGLDQRCHWPLSSERPRSSRATKDGTAVPLLAAGAQGPQQTGEGTQNPNPPPRGGACNGRFLVCVWVQAHMRVCEGHASHRMIPPPLLSDPFPSVTGPTLLGVSISTPVLCTSRNQYFEVPLAFTFAQMSRKP